MIAVTAAIAPESPNRLSHVSAARAMGSNGRSSGLDTVPRYRGPACPALVHRLCNTISVSRRVRGHGQLLTVTLPPGDRLLASSGGLCAVWPGQRRAVWRQ